jgi:nucleoside-specific outer membrane channel protein Tsx
MLSHRLRPGGWLLAGMLVVMGLVAALVSVAPSRRAVAVTHARLRSSATGAGVRLASLPLQAQSVISTTLGSAQPRFAARRSATGYRLSGGRVAADLGSHGLSVDTAGGSLSMALRTIGHGPKLQLVRAISPSAHGNRVTYQRVGVAEWYASGPLGIEQGFTITRRPAGADGLLTLALALGGSLHGVRAGSQVRFLTRSGQVALRYGGLSAVDARGRRLAATLALNGSRLFVRVVDRGARYPLQIDPLMQQAKLTASDGAQGDLFGFSVALSGTTALIGAQGHNSGTGVAYVFSESGGVWSQRAELTASDGAQGDEFGGSVALSGTTALIGAQGPNYSTGVAYVFSESGGVWSQQAELTASDGAQGDYFGVSVALSGTTALVGAWGHNTNTGAAYVFSESGGVWSQQAELTASDGAQGDLFGSSVAVSGTTALIGAYNRNNQTGAAYVFSESGGVWSPRAELTASDGAQRDVFGFSVAVSGTTALVGAWGHNTNTGVAYVFSESGGVWSQQAELTASDGAQGDLFGVSVALSGTTALIGAQGPNSGTGVAYVFSESGGVWSQQAELTASDGAQNDYFGWSVALSETTALIGAYERNSGTGAAYVFGVLGSQVPQSTSRPLIGTSAFVGQTSTCSPGSWSGSTPLRFSYRWLRDGSTPVSGPSASSTYRVAGSDYNHTLSCEVIATGPGGSASAASNSVPVGGPPCFGLTGDGLARCKAHMTYAAELVRCAAISTATLDGYVRNSACVDRAKSAHDRELSLIGCRSLILPLRAVCVAIADVAFLLRQGPTAPIHLTMIPIGVEALHEFRGRVGSLSFPASLRRELNEKTIKVAIDWGDGTQSAGTLHPAGAVVDNLLGRIAYSVDGSHRYTSAGNFEMTSGAKAGGYHALPGAGTATVQSLKPVPTFVVEPGVPSQGTTYTNDLEPDSIAVVAPTQPTSYQTPIVSYVWNFGDGATVVDSPATRPVYNSVLAALSADPGNAGARAQAQALGILPPNQGPSVGPFGGFSSSNVAKVVQVWKQQFKYHNVPHVFPDPGHVGVRLSIIDRKREVGQSVQNLTVSPDCLQWAGNGILGWNPFRGFTDCNTRAGIDAVADVANYRLPDYLTFSVNLGSDGKGFAFGGGVTLTVTNNIVKHPLDRRNVFLGLEVHAGPELNVKPKVPSVKDVVSVTAGWVGPPDNSVAPPDAQAIYKAVNGGAITAGFGASILGLGLNVQTVLGSNGSGGIEAELPFGKGLLTLGGYGGLNCSVPLGNVPGDLADLLRAGYRDITHDEHSTSTTGFNAISQAIHALIAGAGGLLGRVGHGLLTQCLGSGG